MAVVLGGGVGASCLIRSLLFSYLNSEEFAEMAEKENCSESSFTSPLTLADVISCCGLYYTRTHEALRTSGTGSDKHHL